VAASRANIKMTLHQVGGVEDHIHALVMASSYDCAVQIAKFLKGESSLWIHEVSLASPIQLASWLRGVHGE
jgi:REP element-mobilizing transposase RayT